MELEFKVRSADVSKRNAEVEFQGEKVSALVDCLEVTLGSTKYGLGKITLQFTGSDFVAAKEVFKIDSSVSVVITAK